MPRIPHPDENVPAEEDRAWFSEDLPLEVDPAIEKFILDADSWASDWRLRELEFETDARMAEHHCYLGALHKVCRDYSNQVLKNFPLGIARWLAQEVTNVCNDLPSQLFKRPHEGVRTANFAPENQFEFVREEWAKQGQNPAFVLQALSIAHDQRILPPDWVLESLIEAGAKVYESDGDIDFGEALGLTPKKIKEARSGQKKAWMADLVAEAIDAGLSPDDARELAIFEAMFVYGWKPFATGTVQKYYELHANERDGFGRSFMYSFGWYGLGSDSVYQSFRLPFWRRKVLRARLEAYREAVELYPDTNDNKFDSAQKLQHVTSKTIAALRRKEPHKNKFGHFAETDF